jgi:cAMP-dependent protein kinase regulator
MNEGNSFGELALLYNAPRQATIRAQTGGSVFSLDRETYRFVLAQSSTEKAVEIKKVLRNVPLLEGLTEEQRDKICDAVEIFPYKAGE